MPEINSEGLTYRQWMAEVDGYLVSRVGLTSNDLADGPSYDSWADDMSPEEYSRDLLYDEGLDLDEIED